MLTTSLACGSSATPEITIRDRLPTLTPTAAAALTAAAASSVGGQATLSPGDSSNSAAQQPSAESAPPAVEGAPPVEGVPPVEGGVVPTEGQLIIIQIDDAGGVVVIQNGTSQPQDLNGWYLKSERGAQVCLLNGVIVGAGQLLKVYIFLPNPIDGYPCGLNSLIWDTLAPDPVILYNPQGVEVSRLD